MKINYSIYSIKCSSDNKLFISGDHFNYKLILWDLNSGKNIKTLSGHKGSVYSACFSHNNSKIISGSRDTTIKIWDS
jgi:WD40 repeat protein